ncbi:MAG: DUF488 domain-containing protein [Cyanothece sp. SIO2G6]|nr:DUF488 domain-containing protein [Cyanothece sp. SIO2G6]
MPRPLFSIGHSNHDIDTFIKLLRQHQVAVLVDVRSHPYSRYNQQFRQAPLRGAMAKAGIDYVFLGRELGPRSTAPNCYVEGQISYEKLAQTDLFHQGLQQVQHIVTQRSAALMCAEYDPISCHRAILVSRPLHNDGYSIRHILRDGTLETHRDLETRLLTIHQLDQSDALVHSSGKPQPNFAGAIAQLDLLTPSSVGAALENSGDSPSLKASQQLDLFADWSVALAARRKAIAEAYRRQGQAIAYRK